MSTEQPDEPQIDTSIDIRIDLSDLDENIDATTRGQNNEQTVNIETERIAERVALARPFAPWDEAAIHNHGVLRRAVKTFWIDGALESSLHREMLIRFGLVPRSSAIPFPQWSMSCQQQDQPVRAVAGLRELITIFGESGQPMLIQGGAGAGKTTTLLHLAEALLEEVEDEPRPTPVVFNLSSWGNSSHSVEEWLVQELTERYHMPKEVSRKWVMNDELLLLLDGLDEVAADRRDPCVRAINTFRQAHPIGMVICCRTAEYEAFIEPFDIPTVITVLPFRPEQIANYIGGGGEHLSMLPDALAADPEMQTLAQTPLLLTILALTHSLQTDTTMRPRRAGHTAREHLFDQFIRCMFQQQNAYWYLSPTWGFNANLHAPATSLKWLKWLANRLVESGQSIFQIEDLHRARFLSTFTSALHLPLSLLLSVLYLGILYGLFTLFGYAPQAGILFGVIFGFILRTESTIKEQQSVSSYVHTLTNIISWSNLRSLAAFAFFASVFMGWLPFVLFGVVLLAIFALIYELFGDIGPARAQVKTETNQGTRQSLHNGLMAGVSIWVLVGFSLGLIYTPANNLIPGMLQGVVQGLPFGLTGGLLVGFYGVFEHVAARILLLISGCIPFAYAHFLDYAGSRLFLRKVGGSYIFSQRLIRDHIANLSDEEIWLITHDLVADVEREGSS